VTDTSEAAWRKAVDYLKHTHDELVKAVAAFPDSRLQEQVPGKTAKHHNFFYMLSGVVQHEIYHAGQIALLKKFK
jgi:predicted dinucleotide-utilizing enzyme